MIPKSIIDNNMEYIDSDELQNFTSAENTWPVLNASYLGAAVTNTTVHKPHMSFLSEQIIRVTYAIGIVGNLAAIITLCRGDKKIRNRKHALMLKSLAVNDFVALVGMMMLMNIQSFLPKIVLTRWFCALRVVLRIFGIGSVCIAIVMALERWLALTQPFLYQKHVTYYVVRKTLIILWMAAAILTCLPFLGFGIYYDEFSKSLTNRCSRYRDATEPVDVIYAYVILVFGTLLCVCLVWCNLAVIKVLCRTSARGGDQRLLVRRISRTSSKGKPLTTTNLKDPIVYNTATAEEIAFSKLMATLSVCFIICWMPQMVSILLAQLHPPHDRPRFHKIVFQVADILMLLNYTLDPYIYVLLRGNSKPFPKCIKSIFCSRIFGKRCVKLQDSLRLAASQQDGVTALTTIEITPPPTTMSSPPWQKSLQMINSLEGAPDPAHPTTTLLQSHPTTTLLQSHPTTTLLQSPPTIPSSPIIPQRSTSLNDQAVEDRSGSLTNDADSTSSDSFRNALNTLLSNTNDRSLV